MAASANLTWIAASGAVSYKVEYKLQSSSSWTVHNPSYNMTSITISGLQEGSAYDFRITSNCTTGTSTPIMISGNTPCKDVDSATADFVGTTANLTWAKKPNAVSYKIEYKQQSSSTWIVATGSPLSNSGAPDPVLFSVPGLLTGTAYDFRISVICNEGESTGTVVSVTSTCIAPTNLNVTFS